MKRVWNSRPSFFIKFYGIIDIVLFLVTLLLHHQPRRLIGKEPDATPGSFYFSTSLSTIAVEKLLLKYA